MCCCEWQAHGTAQHGTAQHGTAQHGTARHSCAGMADGEYIDVLDIYAHVRGAIALRSEWTRPLSEVFTQQYVPSDVPRDEIVAEFAHQNEFNTCDLTERLSKVITLIDLLKFYSTCSKLAMAQPNKLIFVVSNVDIPHSLSVLEGLFALRLSLLAGSFCIFLRDRKNATRKQKALMRTQVYDLCLWQADNIVLLSSTDADEMRRKLNGLVDECSICLEPLINQAHGTIVYPYRCEHAFHSSCVHECTACPLCRNHWKPRRAVFELRRGGGEGGGGDHTSRSIIHADADSSGSAI